MHPAARIAQQAQRLDRLELGLRALIANSLANAGGRWRLLATRLAAASPAARLARERLRLESLGQRLVQAQAELLHKRRAALAQVASALDTLSPLKTLERGYAIVQRLEDGAVLKDTRRLTPGDRLRIRLAQGSLQAGVLEVYDP